MKIKIIAIISCVVLLVFAFLYSRVTAQSQEKRYIVKLYSGDRAIGTWVSTSIGVVDGTSLTFISVKGFDQVKYQVRICGKYSVEETN
jgi:hypothetical protein